MDKTKRLGKRIIRIENRFKERGGQTDMDITKHERRIDKLRGKQRKETIKQERNMPEAKIGWNMGTSPLNQNDSIASVKAWDTFKSGYMNRTHKFKGRANERPLSTKENQAEYDREKHEFYYSPKKGKITYIPTDDGEVQDRSGIEKYQLAPDRKTSYRN